MIREKRIEIIQKIAKKENIESISGKKSRKEIEKQLTKAKGIYSQTSKSLEVILKEKDKLEAEASRLTSIKDSAVSEIRICHKILNSMDLTGSDTVNVKKDGDVLYAKDGKWYDYAEEGLVARKRNKEEKEDSASAEDGLDLDFEGADIHL